VKITELKKHLKDSSQDQLIKDIVDLYRKNDFVKDYYTTKYNADNGLAVLIKYKEIVVNEFFPVNGDGKGRLSVAKKAMAEFKKISKDKQANAELMIFYVETGVQYTNCYGDINESFYLSMEGVYKRALDFIFKSSLEDEFKDRCQKIVDDTENIGWGFNDELCDVYCAYFDDDD
jgi:hypothetical protein